MILSIGMIVKNEAAHLRKCLESLMPIKNAVETEIIVVDTGSSDDTVAIAEELADKVLHFEWCKDFSAARNVSLEASLGEWFMFIDADEWFGNSDELIRFFTSAEYKKYNSASYIVRNYTTADINGHYIDFTALRLTRRMANTRFVNPVHERLNTAGEPIKMLGSFAHHFGYANINEGDAERKRQRNLELLEKSIAEKDDDVSPYIQFFDVYYGFDNVKAAAYCRRGIEVNKKHNVNKYSEFVLLKLCALCFYNDDNYTEALEVIKEYHRVRASRRDIESFIVSDLEIEAISIYTYLKLDRKEDAVNSCNHYNDLFRIYKKGKYNIAEVLMCAPRFTGDGEYVNVNIILIENLISNGKFNTAYEKRNSLPLDMIMRHTGDMYLGKVMKFDFDIAMGIQKYSLLDTLFSQISGNDNYLRMFEYNMLAAISCSTNDYVKMQLAEYASALAAKYNAPYNYVKIINMYKMYYCDTIITEHGANEFIAEYDELPTYLADMLFFIMKSGCNAAFAIVKINPDKFLEYYNSMSCKTEFLHTLVDYVQELSNMSLKEMVWFIKVLRICIPLADDDYSLVWDMFMAFAQLNKSYINSVYVAYYINDDMIINLPDADKAAYYCYMAVDNFDNNMEVAMDYLNKALKTLRPLKCVYPAAAHMRAKMYPSETPVVLAELDLLGSQIKSNISDMIKIGNNAFASELLAEYAKINPSDSDINVIAASINACVVDR